MKIFISPPFGNYSGPINLLRKSIPNIIPIIGSYTLSPRKGLYKQIINTVRYNYEYKGWVNNIGLRNDGIIKGINEYNKIKGIGDTVLSIGITDSNEIEYLRDILPKDMNIEINIGCPNIEKVNIDQLINKGLGDFLSSERKFNIIKLPHNVSLHNVDKLYKLGFRQFHCSNTRRIENGGVSGRSLIQNNLNKIEELDRRFFGDIEIIGGGGIRDINTIEKYRWHGAEHISISTLCLNPFKLYLLLNRLNGLNL